MGYSAIGSTVRGYGVSLFAFPKDAKLRQKWVQLMRRDQWQPTRFSKLCAHHFAHDQFLPLHDLKETNLPALPWKACRPKLKPGAVPTLFFFRGLPQSLNQPSRHLSSSIMTSKDRASQREAHQNLPGYVGLGQNANDKTGEEGRIEEQTEVQKCQASKLLDPNQNSDKLACHCSSQGHQYDLKNDRQNQDRAACEPELNDLHRENDRLRMENDQMSQTLQKIFNPDQIDALTRPSGRIRQWTDSTTKKAMHLYFTCGTNGYELILKQGWPLPSISTLNRRMQAIRCEPGTLEEMFSLLETKIESMEEKDKEYVMMCDEMGIQGRLEYNPSLQQVFGYPTIPESTASKTGKPELATKMLVFMLSGVANHWKQMVRYDYTGKSFHSSTVAKIIQDFISKCVKIGLNVSALVMDMGPGNIGVYNELGISPISSSSGMDEMTNSFHVNDSPVRDLADIPHLMKNLRNGLLKDKGFHLNLNIVADQALETDMVQVSVFLKLIEFQEARELKIAPRLTRDCIEITNFSKMKVGPAVHLLSRETGNAIRFLVAHYDWPKSYLTTAFFVEECGKWFDLMTTQTRSHCFSSFVPEKRKAAVQSLTAFVSMICTMRCGQYSKPEAISLEKSKPKRRKTESSALKPYQKGICLSTKSMIELQSYYLNQRDFKFFLCGRFLQDALENVFSSMRRRNSVPTPTEGRNALRIVSTTQFLRPSKYGSYQENDSGMFLSDFKNVEALGRKCETQARLESEFLAKHNEDLEEEDDITVAEDSKESLDFIQGNCLVTFGGCIVENHQNIFFLSFMYFRIYWPEHRFKPFIN
eukprot:TCALIF_12775-PA protein Name:"Similar to T Transposable element P transposase (Drosophila melanogaster)" AED:0.19 eAED:0.30 QI:0/-1/0/1/-1/1/1/0/813